MILEDGTEAVIPQNCTCWQVGQVDEPALHDPRCLGRRAHEAAQVRRDDLEENVVRVSLEGCSHTVPVRRTDEFGNPIRYAWCGLNRCRVYRRVGEEVEVG